MRIIGKERNEGRRGWEEFVYKIFLGNRVSVV